MICCPTHLEDLVSMICCLTHLVGLGASEASPRAGDARPPSGLATASLITCRVDEMCQISIDDEMSRTTN